MEFRQMRIILVRTVLIWFVVSTSVAGDTSVTLYGAPHAASVGQPYTLTCTVHHNEHNGGGGGGDVKKVLFAVEGDKAANVFLYPPNIGEYGKCKMISNYVAYRYHAKCYSNTEKNIYTVELTIDKVEYFQMAFWACSYKDRYTSNNFFLKNANYLARLSGSAQRARTGYPYTLKCTIHHNDVHNEQSEVSFALEGSKVATVVLYPNQDNACSVTTTSAFYKYHATCYSDGQRKFHIVKLIMDRVQYSQMTSWTCSYRNYLTSNHFVVQNAMPSLPATSNAWRISSSVVSSTLMACGLLISFGLFNL
ncbi:uncharacterized protein LOC121386922 [Gigantopelta aegis]|uniref:uncharacterized protein LOC121386922 n=1 Tax=Gigantopelta aegis TaxID=1735272 RepID=UPI001B88A59D|nr:uncharacterized protein LOC121386922 [Gigantopelta aegis]